MAMKPLKYKKEKVIKEDGRYIIFYEFEPPKAPPPKPASQEGETAEPTERTQER